MHALNQLGTLSIERDARAVAAARAAAAAA